MDFMRMIGFWRIVGAVVNTRLGTRLYDRFRNHVSTMSAGASRRRTGVQQPWTPVMKKLSSATVAVVTTAGIHTSEKKPFDVDRGAGDASFRIIPSSCDPRELRVSHLHYPTGRFKEDYNVILPLDHLRSLVEHGIIGRLAPSFYSFGFGGFLTKPYVEKPDGSAWQISQLMRNEEVDYAIFIPA